MAKKVPLQGVTVFRNNKALRLPAGKAFDFSETEIDELRKSNPKLLRDPINEEDAEVPMENEESKEVRDQRVKAEAAARLDQEQREKAERARQDQAATKAASKAAQQGDQGL